MKEEEVLKNDVLVSDMLETGHPDQTQFFND